MTEDIIKDLIRDRAKSNPNKILMNINGKEISYLSIENKINSIMFYLNKQNREINKVSIRYSDDFMVLASIIACNRLKIIPVIMPNFNSSIFNYNKLIKYDFELNNDCIIQDIEESFDFDDRYNPQDIQCILFTSGSSGLPKAVRLTFLNIYVSSYSWNGVIGFSPQDRYLNVLPIYHISGLSIYFRAIYYDFTVFAFKYSKFDFLKIINSYNINCISLIPKMCMDIINDKDSVSLFKNFKIIIIGGDQINENIFNFFNKNRLNGYVSYGMTETSSGISGYFVKDHPKYKKGYLGKFHDGVSIALENGKIKIFSESVMYGYENCKPCEGCLLTSDFGYYVDGKLYFKARKERFIISGGENINLDVVEKLIGEYFPNIDFRVSSKESEKWGEEIVIVISGNKDSKLINSMGEYCRKNLPKYMIPKHFLFIKSMLYDEIIQFDEKIKYTIMDSLK